MRITFAFNTTRIIAGAALVFLESMREFEATLLLGPTGFETLSTIYGEFMKQVISVAQPFLAYCW